MYTQENDIRSFLKNGTTITTESDEYTIKTPISAGGSGLIYRVSKKNSDVDFALKEIYPSYLMDKLTRNELGMIIPNTSDGEKVEEILYALKMAWINLEKESAIGQMLSNGTKRVEGSWEYAKGVSLQQPNCKIVDISGMPFIIMSYLGEKYVTMEDFIEEASKPKKAGYPMRTGGTMSIHYAAAIMVQVCYALRDVHKMDYIHGDIQPGNIMFIGADPEHGNVGMGTLIDFSEAKELKDGKATVTDVFIGTTSGYSSPEIEAHASYLTQATDIYSIGCIFLYDLLRHDRNDQNRVNPVSRRELRRLGEDDENILSLVNLILAESMDESSENRFADNDDKIRDYDEFLIHEKADLSEYPERFADRMLCCFEALEQLTPLKRFSIPANLPACSYFVDHSRDKEIQHLSEELEKNQQAWIWGVGGIGKTELAIEYALHHHPSAFRVIYKGNMKNTIRSIEFARYEFRPDKRRTQEENEENEYREKINLLSEYHKGDLMVIDNFNIEGKTLSDLQDESAYKDVISLNMQILFTTRYVVPGKEDCELRELSDADLLNLFYKFDPSEKADKEDILALIHAVGGHTLTIRLMAATIYKGAIPVQKMLEEFSADGFVNLEYDEVDSDKDRSNRAVEQKQRTINEHLKILWNVANLSLKEKIVMAHASLFPENGFEYRLFIRAEGEEYKNSIFFLIESGWIQRRNDIVIVHPVLRNIINEEVPLVTIKNLDFFENIEEMLESLHYSQKKDHEQAHALLKIIEAGIEKNKNIRKESTWRDIVIVHAYIRTKEYSKVIEYIKKWNILC